MQYKNEVIIEGYVAKEPDIRKTSKGEEIVCFILGTADKITEEEHTHWHNVAILRKDLQDFVLKTVHKGSLVHVEGMLFTRKEEKGWLKQHIAEILIYQPTHDVYLLH